MRRFYKSLAYSTLIKMSIKIALVIIAITIMSYWHLTHHFEQQVIKQLEKYIKEKGQLESNLFTLVEYYHSIFKKEFIFRYQQMGNEDPLVRFNTIFEQLNDGTIRTRPEEFYGINKGRGIVSRGISGFIGKHASVTPEIRRRLLIAYDMLRTYGPAWRSPYLPNFYVSTPNNMTVALWSEIPVALQLPPEYDLTKEEWGYAANIKNNPLRMTTWTGLYYDNNFKDWMVSCVTPVDIDGQHLITIGNDIFLNTLFERAINNRLEGTYNMIFREDGRLIVHPGRMGQIQKQEGKFYIPYSEDKHLNDVFNTVKAKVKINGNVVENTENNELLAVTRIQGTQWYFVTVYPKSLLYHQAFETANFVFLLGFISLIVEVIILFLVLKKQVIKPLNQLIEATEQITQGVHYHLHEELTRGDELARLANSFNLMVQKVYARETTLQQTQQFLQKEIHEHQETETALRKSEERFELAMQGANDGLWDLNFQTDEVYFSPRWKSMLGFSEGEINNSLEEWYKHIHPEDIEEVLAKTLDYFGKRIPHYELVFRMFHKQGHVIWILSRGFALWNENGELVRAIGTHVDVTFQKQIEENLREAKEATEVANQIKSTFLANMSHALRTPLNSILGYTQILSSNPTISTQQQEEIAFIQQSGQYLLTLINDILDLAEMENNRFTLSPYTFLFEKFIQDLVNLFHMRAKEGGISFIYEPLSPLPKKICADEKRLRQILVNLLGNAMKHTQQGGVCFKIQSESFIEGQVKFHFWIIDTGPGIAPETLDTIFSPFQQEIGGQNYHSKRTNVDLSITKKLIDMMGGRLQVESTLGQGSTFWIEVTFPEISSLPLSPPQEPGIIIGFEGQPLRILIVDDIKENREVLIHLLTLLGFEVNEATNGLEAIEIAEKYLPDAILMDLVMPVMDGFEATRRLKQVPRLINIPVIAMSASVLQAGHQKSLAVGCHTFLPKPFQRERLLEALQESLGLTWTYQKTPSVEQENKKLNEENLPESSFSHGPSPQQADILLDLSMKGDLIGIVDYVTSLEQEDKPLVSFANKVRELAHIYDLDGLELLIKKYIVN